MTQELDGKKAFQARRADAEWQCLIRGPEGALYVCKGYRQGRMESRKVGKDYIIKGPE